jgi:hypothetical protein
MVEATTVTRHQCHECDRSYKAYESLCRHRRVHRKGGTHHTCQVCKTQFLRKDILHRHEKIHQREHHTDNGQHIGRHHAGPSQRLRASRCCDQCSRRKIRCTTSGDASSDASCSQCQASNVECTYLRMTARASVSLANQSSHQSEDELRSQGQQTPQGSQDLIDHSNSNLIEQDVEQPCQSADHLDIAAALCSFANAVPELDQPVLPYSVPSLADTGSRLSISGQDMPHPSILLDNVSNDDAQCWNWILDEFIPPSPQMISSRASPSLFNLSRQETTRTGDVYTSPQTVEWELRQSCVFLVVHNCTNASYQADESTDTLMRREGERVASVFPIVHPLGTHLFDWLLELFFQHFHPLWPTFPPGYFDRSTCHSELLLTLAIIGAHYGGEQASLFGR